MVRQHFGFYLFFPYWSKACCEPGSLLGAFVHRISFNPPYDLGVTSGLGPCNWLFRAHSSCSLILVVLSFCLAGNKTIEPWCFHVPKWSLESTNFTRLPNAKVDTMSFESLFADICQEYSGLPILMTAWTQSVSVFLLLFLLQYFAHDRNSGLALWRKTFYLFLLCYLCQFWMVYHFIF